jgi:hypothetical protein
VLIVAGSGNQRNAPNSTTDYTGLPPFQATIYDPATGTTSTPQTFSWDPFCNGIVVLSDGRAFINGGTIQYDNPFEGSPQSAIYDPATNQFTNVQNMADGRWYPTVTNLSNGTVMTFSGLSESGGTNSTVEIYTVGSGWSTTFGSPFTPPLYPRMTLIPNGKVFYSGSSPGTRYFDPSTDTWSSTVYNTYYGITRTYGSTVLLPLSPPNYKPVVMIMGGGNPATNTTELIDLSAASPSWVKGPAMSQPRIEMNATILPSGKVLVVGGSLNDEDATTASLNTDLYDPVANTFNCSQSKTSCQPPPNVYARLYHSNALLLPDATVMLYGGNPTRGTYESHIEIYTPAYLFNSNGTLATRPTITGVPATGIAYNSGFQVQTPNSASVSSVVLIRAGAPTHSFDMEQRMVTLNFTAGSGVLNVTSPLNSNIAPPGYYLLFILNSSGVPSVASFVQLSLNSTDIPPTGTITSPSTNQTITAGQSVSFAGSGSDPDGTISAYSWTFPGGTPSTSTLATPGNVVYSSAGTYTATLTVTDNAGLTDPSPPTRTITVNPSGGGGGGGGSGIAYVGGSVTGAYSGTGSSSTLSVALHQNPVASDLLVCGATWQSSTATASVTDNVNGAWTAAGSAKAGVGGLAGFRGQMFYIPSAVSAATTVTLTTSTATQFHSLECAEYSHSGTVVSLDGTPQYSSTPGSNGVATISGLNTSNSGDMVLAMCLAVDTSCSVGSGYTLRDDPNALNVSTGAFGNSFIGQTGQTIEDRTGVPPGAQSATFGTGATDNVILGLLAVSTNSTSSTPPMITSATTANGTVGSAFSYQITATNSPTSYGATGLPSGLAVNSTTGLISGTPKASGTSTVTLSAINSSGTGKATLTLNIVPAGTSLINFSSGFTAATMDLVGSAKLNGTSLELTDGSDNEAGAAWYQTTAIIQTFTTDFNFQITPASTSTADGFTFTIQANNASAVGPPGGGLGYGWGASGIGSSVAVKFDLYNNAGEGSDSTGLYTNGASPTVPAEDMTSSGVNLHSGDVFHVHMTYDGTNLAMTITDTTTNASFSTSWPVNIPTIAGGSSAFVGFTGGTGGVAATQNILNWTYTSGNSSPIITSATAASGTVGTAFSYQITATNSPTSYGATGLPSGLTVNSTTGLISGTPTASGTSTVNLTATNGSGSGTATLTLSINSGSGGSGFAYVGGSVTGAYSGTGSSSTLSVALHQNPVAGDLLVCGATWQSSTATASVTDNVNGTWTAASSAKVGVGGLAGFRGQMFYIPSAVSAATTVTLTTSIATQFHSLECAEYSHSGTVVSLDGTPQYSSTPGSNGVATISGLSTSNSGDMVLAMCLAVDTSCSAGSGYTLRNDTNALNAVTGTFGNSLIGATGQTIEDKTNAPVGAQSATFGTNTAADNVILGLLATKAQ